MGNLMLQHNGRMLATSGVCNDKKAKASRTLKLMGTASVLASALVLANSAAAQSVPENCTVTPNPLASGSTILCVSPTPIADPVNSPVDDGVEDLTVVVGSAETATVLATDSATAVTMVGNGPQTLNVVNAGSEVGGGVDGANLEVTGSSGALTVNAQGRIVGAGNGLVATNNGSGLTSITTADVQGSSNTGIVARVFGDGGANIDTTAGAVNGSQIGMRVVNDGSGDVVIKTANVRSNSFDGILASSYGSGDLSIDTTAGDVLAGGPGVHVSTSGEGSVSITTGDVTSRYSDAVRVDSGEAYHAFGESAAGAITINTVGGAIIAGDDGIDVEMPLGGNVSITTADVYGESVGIDVSLGGYYGEGLPTAGDLTINTTAGTVTGAFDGIAVDNRGTGSISVVTADVNSEFGEAIAIFSGRDSEGAITVDTKAGTVTGGESGIYVDNNGSGAVTITTADVLSTGYERSYYYYNYYTGEGYTSSRVYGDAAIRVDSNYGSTGDISINTTAGAVTGFDEGIQVNQRGTGAITITTADVTGGESDAIRVNADYGESRATSLPITIDTSAGTLTSADDGIDVESNGGAVTITTADIVARGDGIEVDVGRYYYYYGEAAPVRPTGDITINTVAGSVTGESDGIDVDNRSGGSVSITTADVTAQYGEAIRVGNGIYSTGGVTIDSTAGTLTGGESGIAVFNDGAGGVTVTTADVTSTGWERSYSGYYGEVYTRTYGDSAIVVNNGFNSAGDVTIDTSAGVVTGFRSGIEVYQNGGGDVSITTADVTGQDDAGIEVMLRSRGPILLPLAISPAAVEEIPAPSVTIDTTAGSVVGEEVGIAVYGETSGAITITTADVTGQYGPGIAVRNYGSTGGGVSIDSTAGTVAGNGYAGITVRSSGAGDVTVKTADVFGEVVAVDVRMGGYFGEGYGYGTTGSIVIDTSAGAATGGIAGIGAFNSGEGGIDITTADVSGGLYGILARNDGESQSGITIDTTAGTVASGDIGILAQNDGVGGISIKTADVTGAIEGESYSRYGGVAIGAFNGYSSEGGITIDTTAGAVTGGEAGIAARNAGLGGISITTADVTATGGNSAYYGEGGPGYYPAGSAAIVAINGGESTGGITIDSKAGSVTGGQAGIYASNFGTGGISITTADVSGTGESEFYGSGYGILAFNSANSTSGLSIDTTSGKVTGSFVGIHADNYGEGPLSIKVGTVSGADGGIVVSAGSYDTAGAIDISVAGGGAVSGRVGISAFSTGTEGPITIGGSGSVIGDTVGIMATSLQGPVTVANLTSVVGSAGAGLSLNTSGDPITITDVGTITGTGATSMLLSNNGGSISVQGSGRIGGITSDTAQGIVINTTQIEGSSINLGGVAELGTVIGKTSGIEVNNTGFGSITIAAANVTGQTDRGISVSHGAPFGKALSVSSSGQVTGVGVGISVFNAGTTDAPTTVAVNNVTATGTDSIGIYARGQQAVTVGSTGTVTAAGTAIIAQSFGGATTVTANNVTATQAGSVGIQATAPGAVSVTSTGLVQAVATGILATSGEGATTVSARNVTVTGAESTGIDASGPGNVSVTSTGTVAALAKGIRANSSAGNTTVAANAVTVTAAGSTGIDATALRDVSVTSTGLVSGAGTGILATSETGTVTVRSGAVTATGAGSVGINAAGPGAVSVTTTGTVTAVDTGILARSTAGATTVNAAAVTVTGAGSKGIDASGPGNTSVTATGAVTAVGTGILARSTTGTTTVNANAVTATGTGSIGIDASGPTAVAVTSTGQVSAVATGIRVVSTRGPASVTATGVTATSGPAIDVSVGEGGTGSLTVTTTGTVRGGSAGIAVSNLGSGTTTITNSGSLSASSGPVVRVTGRPVVGNNSGTLTGYVVLTAGNDVLNNSGTIVMTGNSDFGGGNDVLNNTGTILVPVQNGPSAAIETVGLQSPITLVGLETLNNSGLIDLRNGQIGNRLVQPGSYVGSGNATLALDVVLGPTLYASDTFVVGGAATGSTVVQVNFVGNSGNLPAFDDIVLVNAGAGSSASAFTLGNIVSTDLLRLGLRFDSTANDYLLVAGPSAAAYRTSLYAEGFRNVWNMAADNVTRHLAAVRDDVDEEPATPIWLAMTGDQVEREILQPFTQIGFNAIDDLSYDQSYFGLQLGVDLGKGPLSYGVTVGYMTGLQEFAAGQQVDYSSANIGVYADVQSGPLFANILAKYDQLWATAQNVITQPEVDLDGSTWGARAELGLLLGDRAGFFAEPAASLSYTSSDLDGFATPQGTFAFEEDEGLLGKIGGRIGAALGNGTGKFYLGGNYVHEFAGKDSVVFQSGNRTFNLQAQDQRDFAEGRAGVNFGSSDGAITATLEGRIATGGGREGVGGSAMVKFRF